MTQEGSSTWYDRTKVEGREGVDVGPSRSQAAAAEVAEEVVGLEGS